MTVHVDLKGLERPTRAGESPVERKRGEPSGDPEYHGARETLWEAGGTTLQGYLSSATDSEPVP